MAAPDPASVIQATLAPVFLITGTGIFLNFTQTRLFRVVDRTREIARDLEEASMRPMLLRRARLLRNAIALGVLAVAFTVLTTMMLMAGAAFGLSGPAGGAPLTFALAMLAFFAALCAVLWDTVLSVRSVHER